MDSRHKLRWVLMCDPARTARVLVFASVILTVLSIGGSFSRYVLGHGSLKGLVLLFALDAEQSVPTWFSSALLLVCAALLAVIASAMKHEGKPYKRHWQILAIIFLYLAIDEAAGIHELTQRPLRSAFDAGGFLYFTWVVPAIVLVLVLFVSFLGFLRDLPSASRQHFLLAGAVYVGGSLGMELIGGFYLVNYGFQNMTYAMITTVEELLEMIGLIVFIYALMFFMRAEGGMGSAVGSGEPS